MPTDSAAMFDLAGPEFLRGLPKIELHCHLEGSVPAATAIDLARRNGVVLPSMDPERLYEFDDLEGFLAVYTAVSRAMVSAADFATVTYESLADGVTSGNLRYREIAFNPTNHPDLGYAEMLAGITDGLEAAERDLGVTGRLIVAVNREQSPAVAADLLRTVVAHPSDYVVGIGLDHNEKDGPPEAFREAYEIAAAAGLRRTAHAGERGDVAEVATSIDLLGVERVDHGYAVLGDAALLAQAVDRGIHFATCWGTALFHCGGNPAASPIGEMIGRGLDVSISSDDPPCFGTDIGNEYVRAGAQLGWSEAEAEARVLSSVEATFLDDVDRAALRDRMRAELAAFRSGLSTAGAH
jgi:adenosine deaminase